MEIELIAKATKLYDEAMKLHEIAIKQDKITEANQALRIAQDAMDTIIKLQS